ELAQCMEDAEPQRDRLEAAARDRAHERRIGKRAAEAVERQADGARRVEPAGVEPNEGRRDAQRVERLGDLAGMPVAAIDHDADVSAGGNGIAYARISRTRHRAYPH